MGNTKKFEFKEGDIEKTITLERYDTLYLCDLEFIFSLIKGLIYQSDKSVEKVLAYVLFKYSEDDQLKNKLKDKTYF